MNAGLAIYTLLGNRLSLLAQCSVLYQLKRCSDMMFLFLNLGCLSRSILM